MKKFLKEYLPYIIIIIAVVMIRTYIITPVRVTGSSMSKTLSNGDIMILYKQAHIDREDIVVIDKTVEGNNIIKRIIAMPGETIKCDNGVIYINGKKYKDKYAYGLTSDFKELKLKKDEYFVLGDNRIVSKDSRYFGPVKKQYIKGAASFVIFPFKKIGNVK